MTPEVLGWYGRFADGKLAEDWVAYDRLGLFQQLGELPVPRQA